MRPNLFKLFARNASKGSFRAEGNTIYVYDVIVGSDAEAEYFGGISPETFARTLEALTGPVSLRINSPGGDVFGAQAMRTAMANYPGKITAYVDGYAASAASILAVCADRCVMAAGSFMMIHKAWTMALGNSDDLRQTADLLEKIDGTLAQTYADKAGTAADGFAALMAAETWFTGDEAAALGLCDEIATVQPKAAAQAKAWDLSAYDAAPLATTCVTVTVQVEMDGAAEVIDPADPPLTDPITPEPPPGASDEIGHRIRQHAVRMAFAPA